MKNLKFFVLSFLAISAGTFTASYAKSYAEEERVSSTPAEIKRLMRAAKAGDNEAVKEIIESGVDVNAKTGRDGETALIKASKAGHVHTVRLLLSLGADPNISYKDDKTALSVALQRGQSAGLSEARRKKYNKIVKILERGYSPTPADIKRLVDAAKAGKIQEVIAAIEAGTHVDSKTSGDGETALIKASKAGHEHIVRLLISLGADRNISYGEGKTALSVARQRGHTEVVRILEEE